MYSHLDDIPVGRSAAVANRYRDLDKYGTELWNLSAQLKRDGSATAEHVCLGIHTVDAVSEGLSSPLQFEYLHACSWIVHKVLQKALNEVGLEPRNNATFGAMLIIYRRTSSVQGRVKNHKSLPRSVVVT